MANKVNPRIRLVMSILLLLTLSASVMGKTIYVDDDADGTNDGTSWENAYVYLQDALADANDAEKPVEVRIAQGIYKPDQGASQMTGDRQASFQLINDVTLKGGFAGIGELDPYVRDVEAYETILSGDLNGDDLEATNLEDLEQEPTRTENSYHVVTVNSTDETAVLGGFTITGGNANGPRLVDEYPDEFRLRRGGGVYNWEGSPTLTNCTFLANSARYSGGGMANSENSSPTLTNCKFSGNWGEFGGGMANSENSSPTLTNCTFLANSSLYSAGGMANLDKSSPTLTNCTFSGNSSRRGGGMENDRESSPTLTNCTFIGNSGNFGGGMDNSNISSPILINCTFSGNSAEFAGGGMKNDGESNPTLTNCTFSGNLGEISGGGMDNYEESSPTLTNCTFSGNSAQYGGGMYSTRDSSPTLINCTFSGNSSQDGGGMYNGENYATSNLINCTFSGNSAQDGGGMYIYQSNTIMINCTFAQNSAENGNALYCDSLREAPSNVELINCILWDGGNEIWNNDNYSTIMITYSNVQGGFPGEGNIDADPLFARPGFWADVNNPNIIVEPNDPNAVWIDGDYHLKSEAGRWDLVGESWIVDDVTSPCIDAGDPNSPVGDEPEPNGGIINMGAYGGTAEASMSLSGAEEIVYIQWLGHSSVKVWTEDCIVYVDPQSLSISPHDATLVCVTHTHGDHYSSSDIARVSNAQTRFIAPPDVVQRYGSGQTIAPGQTMEFDYVNVKAVPSYNTNKPNHPKSNNWVGYIIELGGKRIYVAGDTDLIEEMRSLGDIDVAILPAGGTYTMNATEAAEATEYIKPDLAIPYHWGRNVGTLRDAETFAELARCAVRILTSGETISSDNWPVYSPLIAHWTLDEAEGDIAQDSAGENHGMISGDPAWQPAGGNVAGALQFDGIDDYISTDFVLDPADGAFSVFAWIKGGAPRQVIISQADILAGRSIKPGNIWLGVDPLDGKLMTRLGLISAGSPIPPLPPLMSESVITDGEWHHIGVVITVSQSMRFRALYLDGSRVAMDTQSVELLSSNGGLRIGAGKNLEAGNFFSGLIDDIRIYNLALSTEEIEELAH